MIENNRTILITGGCGFVGSNLTKFLLRNSNYNVRILDNLTTGKTDYIQSITSEFEDVKFRRGQAGANENGGSPENACRIVTLLEGDIRNEEKVESAVQGIDTVVHLAAMTGVPISLEKPTETFDVNVLGTQNLLEASRESEVENFILASSNAALGDKEPPMHEGMVPAPISPYGASKLSGEALVLSYAHSFDINANALRFANVYGPYSNHKQSVVMKFLRNTIAGKPLLINGSGEQTRDFIHASDIAKGIWVTIESKAKGEVFHIGTGKEITINDLADQVQKIAKSHGYSAPTVNHVDPRPGDIYRNYSDPSKARKELGFKASIEFASGLNDLMENL